MSQYETVMNHLEQHGTITSWEAITNYGITRLADVVYKMRNDGVVVVTETAESDKGNKYAIYHLMGTGTPEQMEIAYE